ncbi:MAG: inositol monophosphatase [Candidatus Hydrogenedentes bacterium]|nr:inositol monophosphatase [Candidatus Hydrogenedentota bacterium]
MKEVDFIKSFFDEVRETVVDLYKRRSDLGSSTKSDPTDYLTQADLYVQRCFHERLQKEFPSDFLIGEELGFSNYSDNVDGRAWIIDPIDGTANFLRAYFPIFCVGVAFCINAEISASGVLVPITGEIFLAEKGAGAYMNGSRLSVSNTDSLEKSCIQVDFGRRESRKERLSYIIPPVLNSGLVRCYGSAIMSFVFVAVGSSDAYVHSALKPWDLAPGILLVEEAGGKTSQIDGSPIKVFGKNKGVIATNGIIHDELLRSINEYLKHV